MKSIPELPPLPSSATDIEGHQVRDLADLVPDLLQASAGYPLKFQAQVVLDDAPDEIRAKVEQIIDARLKSDTARPP